MKKLQNLIEKVYYLDIQNAFQELVDKVNNDEDYEKARECVCKKYNLDDAGTKELDDLFNYENTDDVHKESKFYRDEETY